MKDRGCCHPQGGSKNAPRGTTNLNPYRHEVPVSQIEKGDSGQGRTSYTKKNSQARRDNGNGAQGRGASPRDPGKAVRAWRIGRAEDDAPNPRVPRPKCAACRVVTCRVGARRSAGCCGLGERRCVAMSWTRPTCCTGACTQGYAARFPRAATTLAVLALSCRLGFVRAVASRLRS